MGTQSLKRRERFYTFDVASAPEDFIEIPPHVRKPVGPLLCSHDPATCPCPKPDESSPHPPILVLSHSFYYHSPIYSYVLQVVRFSQFSPPEHFATHASIVSLSYPS